MVKRYLVTTAIEDTWPPDNQRILFLGEWCRLYARRAAWKDRDAMVIPYHWDDRKKLHRDYYYLSEVYENTLRELVATLNALHDVDHPLRYWRILVGPWLGYFIQIVFDRWSMISRALDKYHIEEVCVLDHSGSEPLPNDMSSFINLFQNDYWNEFIYGKILESLDVPLNKRLNRNGEGKRTETGCSGDATTTALLRKKIAQFYRTLAAHVKKDDDIFIFGSYLPKRQELLLQIKLLQVPQLWVEMPTSRNFIDYGKRRIELFSESHDEFERLLSKLILKQIPIAYLEGYHGLVSLTQESSWPKNPKVIFTSCLHFNDDFFKAWAAEKAERGAKVIIGQHGGNYGVCLWSFFEEHQIKISDFFLSWGWNTQESNKIKPIGNFKVFGKHQIKPNPAGKALLVGMAMPRYSYHLYSSPVSAGQNVSYFEDQFRFFRALPCELQCQVLVRLYPEDYDMSQRERWNDRFSNVNFEDGGAPIFGLLAESRLYISTYNATTFLESLAINFPTIMFWNPTHWELRESALPYFDELASVGIFHRTPESAARLMTTVWSDVSSWWLNDAVQSARRTFCRRYAYIPEQPISVMANLLRSVAQS